MGHEFDVGRAIFNQKMAEFIAGHSQLGQSHKPTETDRAIYCHQSARRILAARFRHPSLQYSASALLNVGRQHRRHLQRHEPARNLFEIVCARASRWGMFVRQYV